MAEQHRRIPQGGFAAWLHESENGMRQDPYQRRKNEVVATRLLPLFEQDGGKWDTLRDLNLDPADSDCSLDEFLDHWRRRARGDESNFVTRIRASLREDRPPPVTVATNRQ